VVSRRERVPLMETYPASRVEIYSNRAQARQLDGDNIAPGKVMKIHVRPKALLLCVPQPDADPDLAYDARAAARRAEPVREAAEEKA
jgi:diacylglycerol kinase family enzyme